MLLYGKSEERKIFARAIDRELGSNVEHTLVTDSAYPPSIAVTTEGFFYVSDTPGGQRPLLRFYDCATRETRIVANLPGRGIEMLTLSPDGAELLYASQAESGADLVLLEFAQPSR